MNIEKHAIIFAGGALIVGGLFGYLVGQHNDWRGASRYEERNYEKNQNFDNNSMYGMHRMGDGSQMSDGMGMMNHGMMMVSSEKEFITEMIPHHEEAIETAKEVLARGATTPETKALAEGIVVAQEKEIADMKAWHEAWYGAPYKASGNYQPMMRDLEKLSGTELDKAFLEDMIPHHMGAIMMAHSVQGYVEHDEMRTLTRNIITTQSEEIGKMQTMLKQF